MVPAFKDLPGQSHRSPAGHVTAHQNDLRAPAAWRCRHASPPAPLHRADTLEHTLAHAWVKNREKASEASQRGLWGKQAWCRTHGGCSRTCIGAIPCVAWGQAGTVPREEGLMTDMGTCWTWDLCTQQYVNIYLRTVMRDSLL